MAFSTNNNPATHDPAATYWDWEKIKIMNRPSGLPSPQQPPWDRYLARPEQPRAGTLKRSNAFVGGYSPGKDDLKNDKTKTMKVDYSKSELDAKLGFPEALYSEAKRRAVEDMGSQFMHTIQKLDRGDLKEPVDFNYILERHWDELAEFYSTQVSTVQGLGRKLKNAAPNLLRDLPPASSPQPPSYSMSQLSDLKLCPFTFTKPERKSDFTSYLESEENMFFVEDGYTTGSPNENIGTAAHGNADELHAREITKAQTPIQNDSENSLWVKTGVTTTNPCIMENISKEMTGRKIHHKSIGDNSNKLSFPEFEKKITLKETYGDPNPGFELTGETGSTTKLQVELNSCVVEPETAVKTSQFSHSNTLNSFEGYKNKNDRDIIIQQTKNRHLADSRGASITYPMTNYMHLIENHYKALAEAMRLAATNPGDVGETYTDTDLNIPTVVNSGDGAETMNNKSRQSFHQLSLRLILPPPQFADCANISTTRGPNLGTFIGEQIQQYGFIESTVDNTYGNAHKPDLVESTNDISDRSVDNGEISGKGGSPKTESLPDVPYSTPACAFEKFTLNEAGATPRSPSHDKNKETTGNDSEGCLDLAIVKPLPHDSSNDSFSASDDSHLFCGSTKYELEKLQIEVKEHLEQAEKKGRLLVTRWANESSIEIEMKAKTNEPNSEAKASKAIEDKDDDDDDDNEEEDDDGEDERIEVYEFEYADDCEESDDEKIDEEMEEMEEMEEILAWISLEDVNGEEDTKPKDKGSNLTITNSEKARIEEILNTTDSDDDEEASRQDLATTHVVVEKELSVVNEEDGDEDKDDSDEKEEDEVIKKMEGKGGKQKGRIDENGDEINEPIAGTEESDEGSERKGEKGNAKLGDAETGEDAEKLNMRAHEKPAEEHNESSISSKVEIET